MPFKRKISRPMPPKRSSRPMRKGKHKAVQSEPPRSAKPRRAPS